MGDAWGTGGYNVSYPKLKGCGADMLIVTGGCGRHPYVPQYEISQRGCERNRGSVSLQYFPDHWHEAKVGGLGPPEAPQPFTSRRFWRSPRPALRCRVCEMNSCTTSLDSGNRAVKEGFSDDVGSTLNGKGVSLVLPISETTYRH